MARVVLRKKRKNRKKEEEKKKKRKKKIAKQRVEYSILFRNLRNFLLKVSKIRNKVKRGESETGNNFVHF